MNADSPPQSLESKNLTAKQYFMVNLSKFIVELVGTTTLGIFYCMIGDQPVGILLGLWVIILFGEAISGAHYNPAITLVFMLRKNSTHLGTRRLKGIIYIGAQVLGGIAAGLACRILSDGINTDEDGNCTKKFFTISPMMIYDEETPPGEDEDFTYQIDQPDIGAWDFSDNKAHYHSFAAMLSEATGAFVFIFLFMLCTDSKTRYSDDKVINCFIMSASYSAARLMGAGGLITVINRSYQEQTYNAEETCVDGDWVYIQPKRVGPLLNPAIAIGNMIFTGDFRFLTIYPLMPFVGSLAALVFYEMVFVKSQEYLNEDDSNDSDNLSMDADQIGGAIDPKKNEPKPNEESVDE